MSRRIWLAQLVTSFLIAIVFVFASLILPNIVLGASNFEQPVPGTHVYDRAGVLTPEQRGTLEQQARAVEAAGAPVVVYIQAKSASYDDTENDAQNLMDAWDIQSAPGARDGLVLFINVKPKDEHHGQAAFYAGKAQYDGGNLPQYELQRIFDHNMKPLMANGDLAGGISAGLVEVEHSLRNGPAPPPEPSAFETFSKDVSDGPFSPVNLISVVVLAIYLWFVNRVWRGRPRSTSPIAATTDRPDELKPAMVGALVSGRISDSQIEATILDLARRGALAIEQAGKKRAQVRLIDDSVIRDDMERSVWASLAKRSDDNGVVSSANLPRARSDWGAARKELRRELEDRGWFDPNATRRRGPVYLAVAAVALLAIVAFVFTVVAAQVWGSIAVGLLAGAAIAGVAAMMSYPDTTRSGEEAAANWQSYIAGIKRAKADKTLNNNLSLDEAMPYAVAAGVTSALDKHLKQASENGYAPAWLGPTIHQNVNGYNAYACWFAFHSTITPSTSSTSGAGSASAGGGGAGGSF